MKFNKILIYTVILVLLFSSSILLSGCGNKEKNNGGESETATLSENEVTESVVEDKDAISVENVILEQSEEIVEETEEEEEEEPEEVRPGFYRSEITNEWTDEAIKDQRPIAVMVDNEIKALPHFGTSRADVVYEMMNSTQNDRVTRFMCIFKDYNSVSQIGSIRSVRTTNLQIAPEFNAIVIHDGGPLYINAYFNAPYVEHLSGGFSRIKNGKPTEFTEYITEGQITDRCEKAGISLTHNEYFQGNHWEFSRDTKPTDLSQKDDSIKCEKIDIPYPHNNPKLEYIEETGTYRYSEYGDEYIDALTDEHLEFTNIILQECDFEQFDEHGYMNFFVHEGENKTGYFITKGYAIPIVWAKNEYDMYPTFFFDKNLKQIQLNTGKTYVCIVPSDSWDQLEIK